jgi:hypothetical protein
MEGGGPGWPEHKCETPFRKRPWVQSLAPFKESGVVVHTCTPSYSGGRDWENCSLRPSWVKSWWEPSLTNKPGMVACASYVSSVGRRTAIWGWLQAKIWDSIWKQLKHTKTVDVVEVIEHLPSKCESLSSNPSTTHTPWKDQTISNQLNCISEQS